MPRDNPRHDDTQDTAYAITAPETYLRYQGRELNGEPVQTAFRCWERTATLSTSVSDAFAAIGTDELLSDKGKADAYRREANKVLGTADAIRRELQGFTGKHVAKAREAVKGDGVDPILRHVRQAEIRQIIERRVGGDGLQMKTLISEAIQGRDGATLDAIIDSPTVWRPRSLVDDLEALTAERLHIADQELGPEVAELITATSEVLNRLDSFSSQLESVAAPELADNVKRAAMGATRKSD